MGRALAGVAVLACWLAVLYWGQPVQSVRNAVHQHAATLART